MYEGDACVCSASTYENLHISSVILYVKCLCMKGILLISCVSVEYQFGHFVCWFCLLYVYNVCLHFLYEGNSTFCVFSMCVYVKT